MRPWHIFTIIVASFWLFLNNLPAEEKKDLAAQINALITGPNYRQADWGILVVDSATGKTVYEHNPDRLFLPASTTKLYSCAAALIALGPDYKFETPVYCRGKVDKGRLDGDLILVAQGDLTLGGRTNPDGKLAFKDSDHTYANFVANAQVTDTDPLAGLKSLARQCKEAGIKQVSGEVLIDDRLFTKSRGSGSGPDLLTPIMVNDNVVDVIVTPGDKAGEPATVKIRPETDCVLMDTQVTTSAEGKDSLVEVVPVGPHRFVVRGKIALKSKPLVRIYPVEDPALFARALFIEALRNEGVKVIASPLQAPAAELPEAASYAKLKRLALFTSPPFSEGIKVTLKVSHNLYASTLPLLVAVKHGKKSLEEGLRLEGKILADLGVEVSEVSFAGGAGGANADAVTPRATVQLLRAMAKKPEYEVYHAGLPVLGVDGTLAEAVEQISPARGKAQAKTGTLVWKDLLNDRTLLRSKALAGTLTTAQGRSLTFAMFVNNVWLPKGTLPSQEGKVLGRICEMIYQGE